MQQNCFQFYLPQEDAASGNNIVKEPPRLRPKLKKKQILNSNREYLL